MTISANNMTVVPTYMFLDTCVWVTMFLEKPELLTGFESFISEVGNILLVNEVVITEWQRTSVENSKKYLTAYNTSRKALKKLGFQSKMASHESFEKFLGDRRKRIDDLIENAKIIDVSEERKVEVSDRSVQKATPFHRSKSKSGVADELIFFSLLDFVTSNMVKEIVFISGNINDFGSERKDDGDYWFHEDLCEFVDGKSIIYYPNIGEGINHIRDSFVSEEIIQDLDRSIEDRRLRELRITEAGIEAAMINADMMNSYLSIDMPNIMDTFTKNADAVNDFLSLSTNMPNIMDTFTKNADAVNKFLSLSTNMPNIMETFMKNADAVNKFLASSSNIPGLAKSDDDQDDEDEGDDEDDEGDDGDLVPAL